MSDLFLYGVICHEEERQFCELELRSLLQVQYEMEAGLNIVAASKNIDINRSPFIKQKLIVKGKFVSWEVLLQEVMQVELGNQSFRVEMWAAGSFTSNERKKRAADLGKVLSAVGTVNLIQPDVVIAAVSYADNWYVGIMESNDGSWQKHKDKPRQYSTALSTKMARAIVNIAVPKLAPEIRLIDPCCGIGTVLLEALGLGIQTDGCEINPLAAIGARENIAYYGYSAKVTLGDMREIAVSDGERYDCAIIDMPYNLCSVLPEQDKLDMLKSIAGFAKKAVIITVETLDHLMEEAGLFLFDRCAVHKGKFKRDVLIVKSLSAV